MVWQRRQRKVFNELDVSYGAVLLPGSAVNTLEDIYHKHLKHRGLSIDFAERVFVTEAQAQTMLRAQDEETKHMRRTFVRVGACLIIVTCKCKDPNRATNALIGWQRNTRTYCAIPNDHAATVRLTNMVAELQENPMPESARKDGWSNGQRDTSDDEEDGW